MNDDNKSVIKPDQIWYPLAHHILERYSIISVLTSGDEPLTLLPSPFRRGILYLVLNDLEFHQTKLSHSLVAAAHGTQGEGKRGHC